MDELPAPVEITAPFAEYRSKVEVAGKVLKFVRTYQVTSVLVPADRVEELRKFYSQIDVDERACAILRPSAAAPNSGRQD